MGAVQQWLKYSGRIVTAVGALWKTLDIVSGLDWARENAPGLARWVTSLPFPDISVALVIVGVAALIASFILDKRYRQPGGLAPAPRSQRKAAERLRPSMLALMRSFGQPAMDEATRILRDLTWRRREAGEGEIATLVEHQHYDPALRALALANNALTRPESDGYNDPDRAQELFGAMYRAYQGVSSGILSCFNALGERPRDHVLYASWRRVDEQFVNDLRRLAAQDGFESLRREAAGVGHGEGVRRDLDALDAS